MRRRRHRLEVSTFPFLAVLLCAMGSLILILLVLDRRAKAAAIERAQKAVAEQLEQRHRQHDEVQARIDEARAERQRQREQKRRDQEKLAEELQRKIDQKRAEVDAHIHQTDSDAEKTRGQIAAASDAAHAAQARFEELRRKLLLEKNRLLQQEGDVKQRQSQTAAASNQADVNRSGLARLTADLEFIERTLAELKEARRLQEHTYSVVPYKGRRGDDRKPIYIECTSAGFILHPDRSRLSAWSSIKLLDEVRTRYEKQAPGSAEKPYVLFLIRPETDAIETYYRGMGALQSEKVDFGYELVDADWVLDFSDDEKAVQPWAANPPMKVEPSQVAEGAKPRQGTNYHLLGGNETGGNQGPTMVDPFSTVGGPRGRGTGWSPGQGNAATGSSGPGGNGPGDDPWGAGYGGPRQGSGHGPAGGGINGQGFGGNGSGGRGSGSGSSAANGGSGQTDGSGVAGAAGNGAAGNGSASSTGTIVAGGSQASQGSGQPSGGSTAGPGSPDGGGATRGGGNPSGRGGSPTVGFGPAGRSGGAGSGEDQGVNWLPPPPGGGSGGAGSGGQGGQRGTSGGATGPGVIASSGPSQGGASGSAGSGGQSGSSQGTSGSGPSGGAPGTPGSSGQSGSSDSVSSGAPSGGASGTQGARGQGGPASGPDHGEASTNPPSGEGPPPLSIPSYDTSHTRVRPSSPTLAPRPLVGDRDWIVPIECTGAGLIVYPGRENYALAGLTQGSNTAQALVDSVRLAIQKRQATVREGEPPYRPIIRFLVRPDGVEAMTRAYPLLMPLRTQMYQVELRKDETIDASIYRP